MQKIIYITAFIFAFLQIFPANAQLPEKIQGNWALPDCRAPEKIIINTANLSLKISAESMSLAPIKQISNKNDYSIIEYNKNPVPTRVFNDGIMEIAYINRSNSFQEKWDHLPITQREEYMKCYEISSSPHHAGINAISVLNAHCKKPTKKCAAELNKLGVSTPRGKMLHVSNDHLLQRQSHVLE